MTMPISIDSTSPATGSIGNTQLPSLTPKDPKAKQLLKPPINDNNTDDEMDDETSVTPTINDIESLRKGHLKTEKNIPKLDYTILVVGETGVGKSSVLEFIANVIAGNPISKYDFNIIDKENEAGGSGKNSQTNSAKTYIFESANGHTVRILDTPGLADTRGIEQDEKHKRSIANEIANNITTVTGVIILANGTVPRITVGTDYALSTLSAIFPRSLVDNIGFMFTNVSNPLSWNFAQDSIPEVLKKAPQFLLDNPLALRKKFLELRDKPGITPRRRKGMEATVKSGETKALEMLVDLFDWLDRCTPQPTKDIISLYDRSQGIEKKISNILASMDQLTDNRNELQKIANETEKAKSIMSIFEHFETIANQEVWVQKSTGETHNTLCVAPQCYSNCHLDCQLSFTLRSWRLKGCSAMGSGGNKCVLPHCGHDRSKHQHFNVKWEKEKRQEKIVDEEMKEKFNAAKSEKEKKEHIKAMAEKVLKTMSDKIDGNTAELGRLAEEYSNLSLSGSFSDQVEKAVVMLKQYHEALKGNNVNEVILNKVEGSLNTMKQKLEVLKKATEKKASIVNQVKTLARATNSQTVPRRETHFLNGERAVLDPSDEEIYNTHQCLGPCLSKPGNVIQRPQPVPGPTGYGVPKPPGQNFEF